MVDQYKNRAWGAFLGLAVGDALGAPAEFKERDSFPVITEMQPGGYFNLPAGAWTDDTAMALCLADCLIHNSNFDASDLLRRFLRWMDNSENTSTGKCIGIGQNTIVSLGNYRRTGSVIAPFVRGRSDGNGALMRLSPIAVRYWRSPEIAQEIAIAQSRTTHYSELSEHACTILAELLSHLIAGGSWSELDVRLSTQVPLSDLRRILRRDYKNKTRDQISSGGYVIDTLEAALWAVETTESFEDALIAAVNLGHDADTVGAVAGQLAGARYGASTIPERWVSRVAKLEILNSVFDKLWHDAEKSIVSVKGDK